MLVVAQVSFFFTLIGLLSGGSVASDWPPKRTCMVTSQCSECQEHKIIEVLSSDKHGGAGDFTKAWPGLHLSS